MKYRLSDLPDLSGQKIIITGAAGGLGSQITAIFAARGAQTVAHVRNEEKIVQARSTIKKQLAELNCSAETPEPELIAADLAAGQSAAAALITAGSKALNGLTGLINCAAVQPVTEFESIDETVWEEMIAANLNSAHHLTRLAAAQMPEGGWITHIASIEAIRPAKLHSHYAVSKAALVMHAKAAALELGAKQIRVNAVSPGLIDRPGLETDWEAGFTSWQQHAPLKKLVTAADVAAACAFLASPLATAITGHNLVVDSGMLTTPGW